MASVAPLLQKLDPMTMMEDGGLQRASIAIKLLAQQSATDPSVGSGILEAKGMRILLQTALLHPVPELREGAIVTILGCVQRDAGADSAFVAEALEQQLPVALVRLCSEQDRRAKREENAAPAPDGGEAAEERAYDPDLPARRVAVQCISHLLLSDAARAVRVLSCPEWPGVVGTIFALLGSSDAQIRQHGAALMGKLLGQAAAYPNPKP